MKKRELKKRIEDGFSELSPDLFEAVYEECQQQEVTWAQADSEEPSGNGKIYTGRFPRYALSLCASLAVLCLCILGVLGQKEKTVYMVLDINPSIQVEVNEAHQVKRLKGLNQDGKDVVKELKWKKRGTVQELLDVLIQDVVEKSYLRENGGILVTLAAKDKCICENLERTLGEGIDRKLTELKVSGVTTAFQEAPSSSEREGRKLLEAELTKSCGLDEKQVQQMSVMELIRYCHDYTSVELKLSEASKKEWETGSQSEDKSQKAEPSVQKGTGQKPGDSASENKTDNKSDSQKTNSEGNKNESSKEEPGDDNGASQGDNEDIEGNTKNQQTDKADSASLNQPAQNGESIPSATGTPIQSGDDEPLETDNGAGQAGNGDKPQPGNSMDQPADGSLVTPGSSPGKPGVSGKPEAGDTPGMPEEDDKPVTEDIPREPEDSDKPEAGDISGKPEGGDTPGGAEDGDKPEAGNSQGKPDSGSLQETGDAFGKPENDGKQEAESDRESEFSRKGKQRIANRINNFSGVAEWLWLIRKLR
jgi:hypothetical protein